MAPSTPPRPPFSSPFHTTHHTPFRPLLQLPTLDPPSLHNSFNASTQAYRLFSTKTKILYTYTDEAPMYATHSLLPIIQSFTRRVGVEVEKVDLSFTARVLALFPERLTPQQRVADSLAELGKVVKTPVANVIKLPNVSASVPQLVSACVCVSCLPAQHCTAASPCCTTPIPSHSLSHTHTLTPPPPPTPSPACLDI